MDQVKMRKLVKYCNGHLFIFDTNHPVGEKKTRFTLDSLAELEQKEREAEAKLPPLKLFLSKDQAIKFNSYGN